MAIQNSVSNYFLSTFVDSINISDCRLSGVLTIPKCEVMFVCIDPLCPSQQIISHVGTGLPGLNQY